MEGGETMEEVPKKKNWFIRHKFITGIIVVFIVLMVIGAASGGSNNTPSSNTATSNTRANQQTQSQQKSPRQQLTHILILEWSIHSWKNIQPGTYRTRVASSGCYFERLSGFGGALDEIIANDNTDFPAIVTIAATDKGFKSQDCGTWTQDVSQITKSTTTFPDGMYIVGTDIQAGTYKNSGQSGCYYSRLSNFSDAGIDGIISNDNTDTTAIVTISATDAGFKSSNCGTWTLQQ